MGIVVEVDSLEQMCDMMCDNVIPGEWWYFTFGSGQKHHDKYVRVFGTYRSAREKMIEKYGRDWAFQYSEDQWEDWCRRRPSYFPVETELEEIP